MIQDAVEQLNSVLQAHDIPLHILPGAEIQSHAAPALAAKYCLAGGSYLLLEFPHSHLPADAVELIYMLRGKGVTPILAHPERNRSISIEPEKILTLLEAGAKAQITAGSITGEFGPDAHACAYFLLKNRLVHYIATDSHSPNFRKPILSKAVKKAKKILGKEEAGALVEANPKAILP
jgi:protein-tyrosine phosphatase